MWSGGRTRKPLQQTEKLNITLKRPGIQDSADQVIYNSCRSKNTAEWITIFSWSWWNLQLAQNHVLLTGIGMSAEKTYNTMISGWINSNSAVKKEPRLLSLINSWWFNLKWKSKTVLQIFSDHSHLWAQRRQLTDANLLKNVEVRLVLLITPSC